MERLKKLNWYPIVFVITTVSCIVLSHKYGDVIISLNDDWVGHPVECYYDGSDIYTSSLKNGIVLYAEDDWIVASGTCTDFEQITTEQGPGVSNIRMEEIGTRRCEDTKLKINCNRLNPKGKYKDMVKNAKIWYGSD